MLPAREAVPESYSSSVKLILDPEEQERFRRSEPGIIRGKEETSFVSLASPQPLELLEKKYADRRSYRHFGKEPIPLRTFSAFLSCLRQVRVNGEPKYLYPSAGGLYCVQTYLSVKPGRVEDVPAGIYYYHPIRHQLLLVTPNAHIDRTVYGLLINRPIFDRSAFGIFLIAQLAAILPMYGTNSVHLATLDAGYMSQLLVMSAPPNHIGLCPIGTLDYRPVRHLFRLTESQVLLHSLLGGYIGGAGMGGRGPSKRYKGCHAEQLMEEGQI
jgi:SagB-type dehydrogenase family enzyme